MGFYCIIYNFLVLYFHTPQGYEVDIYSALPLSFYCASIFCYLISSYILIYNQESVKKFSILLLILNHAVILLIPYMLGYYSMGRADDMSYIGEYLHISNVGFISEWDIYPGSLIFGAIISIFSGLTANESAFIIPFFFSFIFIGGLYLFCRFFLKDSILVNLAILTSFIFYLGPYNHLNVPHALFFAYIPIFILILFKYIKNNNFSTAILILIPTLFVPFMHPFIVFFVFAFFLALIFLNKIFNRYIQGDSKNVVSPVLILLIGFLSWFIYCDKLFGDFKRSYHGYIQRVTEPVFFETVDKLARINVDTFKMVRLLFVYYGRYFIPLIIISLALFVIYLKRDYISNVLKKRFLFFLIFYIIFFIIEAILFLNPIFPHEPDRMTNLNFMVYAQVPLFVLSLHAINIRFKTVKKIFPFLVLLITLMWSLSLFGMFFSPITYGPNIALTNNEVKGMMWFYEARSSENVIVPVSQISRFHSLFDDNRYDRIIRIPNHFGYKSSDESFVIINLDNNKRAYVILLTIDELLYQLVPGYQEVGRYTKEDFIQFRNDQSINGKTYDNKNIEIYYINN